MIEIFKPLGSNCGKLAVRNGNELSEVVYGFIDTASFRVDADKRDEAIASGQRNVHAYVITEYYYDLSKQRKIIDREIPLYDRTKISYNPKECPYFFTGKNQPLPEYCSGILVYEGNLYHVPQAVRENLRVYCTRSNCVRSL